MLSFVLINTVLLNFLRVLDLVLKTLAFIPVSDFSHSTDSGAAEKLLANSKKKKKKKKKKRKKKRRKKEE